MMMINNNAIDRVNAAMFYVSIPMYIYPASIINQKNNITLYI